MDVLEAAITYATNYGWKLIPVDPDTKRPLIEGGEAFSNASSDPEQLRRWWKQHPSAGVAVVCGLASKIVVVDCDVDQDKDGLVKFGELQVRHGIVDPTTPVSRTPRGGMHLIFSTDEDLTGGANKLAKGVDIRGKGQYAILPPTKRKDGACYQWDTPPEASMFVSGGITPLPVWLGDAIKNPLKLMGSHPAETGLDRDGADGWWSPGDESHHRWLLDISGHMRQVMTQRATMELCLRLSRQRCQELGTTFDAGEVRRAVWGAYRLPSRPVSTPYMIDHGIQIEELGVVESEDGDPFAPGDLSELLLHGVTEERYLFDPLLPYGDTTVMAAEAKTGKSWLAYVLAMGVATGNRVLDMDPMETGPVGIFQWEMPWKLTLKRITQLCRSLEIDMEALVKSERLFIPLVPAPLNSQGMRNQFVRTCVERDLKFVVMDSMAGAFAGSGDNALNDNSVVRQVVSETMTQLAHKGITVLGLHHLRKSGDDKRIVHTAEVMKNRILGAQQWQAAVSNLIAVMREQKREGDERDDNVKHLSVYGAGGWHPGADFAWSVKIYDSDRDDPSMSAVHVERESDFSRILRGKTQTYIMIRKLIYVLQQLSGEEEIRKEHILQHELIPSSKTGVRMVGDALRRGIQFEVFRTATALNGKPGAKSYDLTVPGVRLAAKVIQIVEEEEFL